MARPRTLSDDQIFAALQTLLDKGGDKAVSFGAVAQATGLAASTLVQRYGNRLGMIQAARRAAWDRVEDLTAKAIAQTAGKGAAALLKALGTLDARALAADLQDPALRDRARSWQAALESALALRLGGGAKAREAAAALFAAWQGQALWGQGTDSGFRLKDVAKRLI